jgi:hypothetical protein
MSHTPPRVSAARRNAEAMMKQNKKKETNFKQELEREREVLALKSARLRELRLAKEAADRATEEASPPAARRKVRRSKQT